MSVLLPYRVQALLMLAARLTYAARVMLPYTGLFLSMHLFCSLMLVTLTQSLQCSTVLQTVPNSTPAALITRAYWKGVQ